MAEMQTMTLGQVVDFCIEYINRRTEVEKEIEEKKEPKVKTRKATQDDWDRFWG